jgi:hypothetical protein
VLAGHGVAKYGEEAKVSASEQHAFILFRTIESSDTFTVRMVIWAKQITSNFKPIAPI